MVHYKLWYFEFRGAAEVMRQMFAYAEQEYEDYRIPVDEWPIIKQQTPFGHIPILEVDGKPLIQSNTISRYLAKKFGMNGKTEWEEAKFPCSLLTVSIFRPMKLEISISNDYINITRPYLSAVLGYNKGDLEKLKAELVVPTSNKYFTYFQKILKENQSGFLVGDSLTWVDLLLASYTDDWSKKDPELFAGFPELFEHQKKIHSIDKIKKWIETRPDTPY